MILSNLIPLVITLHNTSFHCFIFQLEAGTNEKVCLMSRDEQSVLVVSYRDLKQCFEGAFGEIISASLA